MEFALIILLVLVSAVAGAVGFAVYRKKIADAAKDVGEKLNG
jgi:hypothetical protein